MPVLPISHFTWQVLRTVKRNKKAPTGRALRVVPSRRTKDGTFLNELVERELLTRVTGTADCPFDATYLLTERGEHAAEYGECEMSVKAPEHNGVEQPKPAKKLKRAGRGNR
jgi:hypothetical protein